MVVIDMELVVLTTGRFRFADGTTAVLVLKNRFPLFDGEAMAISQSIGRLESGASIDIRLASSAGADFAVAS